MLEGDYAERLRGAADGLVDDLEKVHRRYSRVAAALRQWEPQLREAQGSADRIRLRAGRLDDEQRALRREAASLGGPSPATAPPSAPCWRRPPPSWLLPRPTQPPSRGSTVGSRRSSRS